MVANLAGWNKSALGLVGLVLVKYHWVRYRPAYPKILVSTPNCLCPYFQIFDQLFFVDAPPINQNKKKCQRTIFLSFILKEECVNSHCQYYRRAVKLVLYDKIWTPLFCLHLLKSFWSKTAEHFLQKQCTISAAFADADTSFLEWLLSDQSLFPWFLTFLLFFDFVQPLVTDSFEFKPAIFENG